MLRVSDMYLPGRCGLSAPWEVTNLSKIIDRKLCGSGFLGRKLGNDDGDKDDEAAKKLARAQCLLEDDPAEEDDPSGQCDEDGINTAGGQAAYALHGINYRRPGCPISDPAGEYDEEGT